MPDLLQIQSGTIYQQVFAKRGDNALVTDAADLETGWIESGRLRFTDRNSAERAIDDGVFFLERPVTLDLDAGDAFAQQFHLGTGAAPHGHFRSIGWESFGDPLLGFHQRSDQIEQFLLERRFWHRFPPEIASLGEAFTAIARIVLADVLELAELPEPLRARATGGCLAGDGSHHLTFNHYRAAMPGIGLSSHKDDGFVTLLRLVRPGLEVNRRSRWEAVPVVSDRLVVNFGLAMELLTRRCRQPVAAVLHRVCHQADDRWSYGHFTSSRCDPGRDLGIYTFVPPNGLEAICTSRDLIDANDSEIYNGTRPPEPSGD